MHSCTNHATMPASSHCIQSLKLDIVIVITNQDSTSSRLRAGQQSVTLCLWCFHMKTTNVLRHLLVPQNPHLTVSCTCDKSFHSEVLLHAYQSLSKIIMTTKSKSGNTEDDCMLLCTMAIVGYQPLEGLSGNFACFCQALEPSMCCALCPAVRQRDNIHR
jgi:hypothetical protein